MYSDLLIYLCFALWVCEDAGWLTGWMDGWKLTGFLFLAKLIPKCPGSELSLEYHSSQDHKWVESYDSWVGKVIPQAFSEKLGVRILMWWHFSPHGSWKELPLTHSFTGRNVISSFVSSFHKLTPPGPCKHGLSVLKAWQFLSQQARLGEALCCLLLLNIFCFSFPAT